jgi:hypothetical protein
MTLSMRAFADWLPDIRNGFVAENFCVVERLRMRMVLIDPWGKAVVSFLSFPYVCPEPVLVK